LDVKRLKTGVAAAIAACAVAGCDHNSLASAQSRYSECLAQNPDAQQRCEELRRAYEAEFAILRVPAVRPIFRRY